MLYATCLCIKKRLRRINVTVRAAQLDELKQRPPTIRAFLRLNKSNDSRRWHSLLHSATDPVVCGALPWSRDVSYSTLTRKKNKKESGDILAILDCNDTKVEHELCWSCRRVAYFGQGSHELSYALDPYVLASLVWQGSRFQNPSSGPGMFRYNPPSVKPRTCTVPASSSS